MKDLCETDLKTIFVLDENSSIPIWLQIKKRFVYLITSGFYMPGDQLPTVRGLAAQIEVNYNTVSKVYQSLEEDGYTVSKHRHGAFVCDVSRKPGIDTDTTAEIVTVEYIKRCYELGMGVDDIERQFNQCLNRERDKNRKSRGALDDQAQQTDGKPAGRIVVFPGAKDASARTSGTGA